MQINNLITRIQRKIQDTSYSREEILDLVNEGLGEIATKVVLPRLATYDTVTIPTSGLTTSMPSTFYAHLLWAYNVTGDSSVKVYHDFPAFQQTFGALDEAGDCIAICEYGHTLYFQYVPSTEQTVRMWFTEEPTLFTADNTDEILYIPKHLQPQLLVNYVCREIFEEIEQGKDQPNFIKYDTRFSNAIGSLINFVGLAQRAPEFIPNFNDVWSTHDRVTDLSDI